MRFNLGHPRYFNRSEDELIEIFSIVNQHEYLHKAIKEIIVKKLKRSKKGGWDITTNWMHPKKIFKKQDKLIFTMQRLSFNKDGAWVIRCE